VIEMRSRSRVVAAAIVLTLALAAASTVAFAVAGGGFRSRASAPNGQCTAPALRGTVVDVELANMGGSRMMGGSGMMGGTMRVVASRHDVNTGTVSFRVANVGSIVHELVVLPLAAGEQVGSRTVGNDGKVSETDSLGEASNTCGTGAGDGINPGALGWVTLHLPRGNYELVCNLPGHYASGMYTELRVG
jgi:uncharacterized cupredoxin-like copper-binding protein